MCLFLYKEFGKIDAIRVVHQTQIFEDKLNHYQIFKQSTDNLTPKNQ